MPQCSLLLLFTQIQPTPAPSSESWQSPQEQPALMKEAPTTLNSSLLRALMVVWRGLRLLGERPSVLALSRGSPKPPGPPLQGPQKHPPYGLYSFP